VISSLLDLQADKFKNRKFIKNSEFLEALRESKARVISMALIHEELYKGKDKGKEFENLDLSEYIQELVEKLFQTYRLGDKNIQLNMDLEENAILSMDDAVPFGIIVNELISNSLKHAFLGRR
jgi:two-component sensor histidine kinase